MSNQPKRAASEDPNPRSPVRQRTSTSENPPSPDVPDGLPEHGLTITLARPDGRRTTHHIIVERPAPGTIPPDIIISLPETRSPTPGDVPEAEGESQEAEGESPASPPSTITSDVPEAEMESPKDEDNLPRVKDKSPKVEDKPLRVEDKLPKEKNESSKLKDESPERMDES